MSVRFEQVSTEAWNIKNKYGVGTKVVYNGKTYVSKQNVPVGVNIGMGDYWQKLELKDDVTELAEAVEDLQGDVEDISDNLTVTVGEDSVPFKFAYDAENSVYGFMVGEVFHTFGGEVVPSNAQTTRKKG